MSGIGRLGGLGKRLLQVAAQRVIAAADEVERRGETRQLPAGSGPAGPDPAPNELDPSPDRFDAALSRLRSERLPAEAFDAHSEVPPEDAP